MPTPEENLETLVDDISALTHLVDLNDDPAIAALAARSTELAALSPMAADLQASADARDDIVAAASNATAAEAARDAAQAVASVTPDTAIGASTLENAIRARYKVSGRHPAVVIDPINDVYFAPSGTKSFADLITYSRSDTASFTDKSGQISWAGANTPRTNHHVLKDGVWRPAGLRVDPEATNLIEDSEDFTVSTWSKNNLTVTPNAIVAPDGNTTAARIEATSTAVARLRNPIGGLSEDSPVTFSGFLKAGNGQYALLLFSGLGNTGTVCFNLATGTAESTNGEIVASTIQDAGKGWYRCSITKNVPAGDSGEVEIRLINSATGSASTPGETLCVWGVQFETSGMPTSYVKTTGITATKTGDKLSIAAEDMPSPSNGFTVIASGKANWLDIDDSTSSNLFNWQDAQGLVRLQLNQSGGYVAAVHGTTYLPSGGGFKNSVTPSPYNEIGEGLTRPFAAAVRMTPGFIQAFGNGNAYAQVPHNGIPYPSASADLLDNFNGVLANMRIFDVALPEEALIAETTL